MTRIKKLTLAATAMMVPLVGGAFQNAHAETVHTKTYVETQELENVNQINFSLFDVNQDGVYEKSEVGTKLFDVFDNDGNASIDNLEWDDETMYTITPMEKETFKFVDHDDDGIAEDASYTYETFYKASGLIRFDDNKNGLSPAEFIGKSFQELDDNNSGRIELDEWQEAYLESITPESADQDNYN